MLPFHCSRLFPSRAAMNLLCSSLHGCQRRGWGDRRLLGLCLQEGFRHTDSDGQAYGPLPHSCKLPQMDLYEHQNSNMKTDMCRGALTHEHIS